MSESMAERVRARAARRKTMGGLSTLTLPEGVELYKPEKGRAEFDILPYRILVDNHPEGKKGDMWYERTYFAHRNVGPEEQFVICPRTIGKKCPVCEEYHRLKADPDADEDVVAALRAKERQLFNVVLKDGKGEVQIMDISYYLFGRKLEEEVNEGDEANQTFPDLRGGKTLRVRWEENSMGSNKFMEAARIDFVTREEDYDDSALDLVVDLDGAMKIMSYDELAAIFHGADEPETVAGKEDADDEPEKPARTLLKRKAAAEPPPEDEDDLPMPPTKKLTRTATPPPADIDDDEDAEPEPPAQKPKAKVKPSAASKSDDAGECLACDGSGKTSKGKTCPICDGTGKDESAVPAEPPADEDPPEEPPKRTARRVVRS